MNPRITWLGALSVALLGGPASAQTDTTFTYQGSLSDGGAPANGTCVIDVSLWDAAAAGSQVGSALVFNGVPITGGIFTIDLDFGADVFADAQLWLEFDIDGTTLSPRQPVTRAPYAIQTRGIQIDSTDRVGFGTASPIARLDVNSFTTNAGNNTARFAATSLGPNTSHIHYGALGNWFIRSAADTGTVVLQDTGGRVGIGTTSPAGKLGVAGNESTTISGVTTAPSGTTYGVFAQSASTGGRGVFGWATASSGTTYGVEGISNSSSGVGVNGFSDSGYGVRGSSTTSRGIFGSSGSGIGVYGLSSSSRGVFGWASSSSGVNYGVRGFTSSSSGYGVWSDGDFGATGTKAFIQPHPEDPSKEIRFVCLEGNESGTYFRGSTHLEGGRAYIEVPEEFRLASESDNITVQLTARGPDAGLWIESSDLDLIVVAGNGDVEFDYFINGVRRGFANHESIRENNAFVPELLGVPFGSQFRPDHRQILVDNGILNPDFTPNERTAMRMGWELQGPETDEFHDKTGASVAHK